MIKLENVHKSFGKNEVLKGIDLHIEKGQVVVIIGPSGSGKSTVLRTMNYLEEPTSGKVIVDVMHNDDLPEILTLGKAAVTAVKSTLEAKIAELDKWAEVSASCDYEEGK